MKQNISLFTRGYSLVLAFCAVACSCSALAEVVAWYRFDELDPGVEATTATVITNYAAPGTIEGTVNTFGSAIGTGGVMPVGTNSFGAKLQIWDPITGNYHTNNRAMHFGARTAIASDAGGAPGSCYIVPLEKTGKLNNLTNVTVEVIFRLNKDVPEGFTACLVDKWGSAYGNKWGVTINQKGLWQRYRYCDQDGSGATTAENFNGGAGKVTRGVWHHAAFTFDAAGKATLWLDYESVGSQSNAGKRLETGSSRLAIGCNPGVANRTFPGEIDEVRISDCALAASQFLRVKPIVEGMDPDTAFYHPLDFDEGAMPIMAMDINAATNAGALVAKFDYLDFTNSVPQGAMDIPGTTGQLRQHVLAPDSTNDGSMYSVTSEVNKATSIRVSDPSRSIYTGSFTAEMFFKGDTTKISSSGSALTLMWGQLKVLLGAVGSTRARAYNGQYSYSAATSEIIDDTMRLLDGKWHHVAVVYDYAASNFTYYVDYVARGSKTTRIYEKSDGYKVFYFGRQVDDSNGPQFFPGWIDSPRIVRRALKPHEFLTTHEVSARPATLAHIGFDTDYSVEPYPQAEPAGTPATFTDNGTEPRLDTSKKLRKIWLDGLGKTDMKENVGSVRMENGSQVRFPRNSLLERPEFTVEFFACLQSAPSGAPQFFRINRSLSAWTAGSTFAMQFNSDTRHLKPHVYMRRFDGTFNDQSPDLTGETGKTVPVDGRWHHYALTAQLVDGTNTMLTAYIDYEPVGDPVTLEGVFYYPSTGTCFPVGVNAAFSGWLDEIRFSDGVLPVSAFMRAEPEGCTIIFK